MASDERGKCIINSSWVACPTRSRRHQELHENSTTLIWFHLNEFNLILIGTWLPFKCWLTISHGKTFNFRMMVFETSNTGRRREIRKRRRRKRIDWDENMALFFCVFSTPPSVESPVISKESRWETSTTGRNIEEQRRRRLSILWSIWLT